MSARATAQTPTRHTTRVLRRGLCCLCPRAAVTRSTTHPLCDVHRELLDLICRAARARVRDAKRAHRLPPAAA